MQSWHITQDYKKMNPESIDRLIAKNPKLRNKRQKLEQMHDGAYCMHGSWGFGRIVSYDEASKKLIIDFEGKPGHKMDPVFCVDKLEVLDDDNLLVRYRTDRENLEKEMKDSGEFVVSYLEKKPDMSASPIELETVFKQLFGYVAENPSISEKELAEKNKAAEKAYRSWWNKAKEALFRNPRVACPKVKGESYCLRAKEEEMKPEQEVLREYFLNREPKKKILLAEKLYKTATDDSVEEIKADLPKIKEELTEAIKKARSLNDADRLHGIWVRNNLVRYLYPGEEEKVEEIAPRSKDIILAAVERDPKDGLNNLAKNLPSSYLERFLDLLTRIFVEDWRDRIIDLLKYSEGRFTKECVDFLLSWDVSKNSHFVKGAEIPDDGKGVTSRQLIKDCLKRWLEEQTLRGPVILWIVKNRNAAAYKDILSPLIGEDLLSALLAAVDDEALQRETVVTTARIALADALSDDKDLIKDMLENSTADTARDLAQTLLLNQGFEDLTKKSILARIIKVFPSVQTLVATKSSDSKEKRLLVSSWSLQARPKNSKTSSRINSPRANLQSKPHASSATCAKTRNTKWHASTTKFFPHAAANSNATSQARKYSTSIRLPPTKSASAQSSALSQTRAKSLPALFSAPGTATLQRIYSPTKLPWRRRCLNTRLGTLLKQTSMDMRRSGQSRAFRAILTL